MVPSAPGRVCPTSYRSRPEDMAGPAACSAETLYVVGGLYGSVAALEGVLARVAREHSRVEVVFNGDFHFLDVDEEGFRTVGEVVARHRATRGNVETELTSDSDDAGCGCAYPDYVGDETVERSNAVMRRLRRTAEACPEAVLALADLPRHLVVDVSGTRIAVLHGDPEHLAGWQLALEALEPADDDVRAWTGFRGTGTSAAQVEDWLDRGRVQVLACTHTGLPYMQSSSPGGRPGLVVNNGAAGLPSFAGLQAGVVTRISTDLAPPSDALYGAQLGAVRCDALPVRYDVTRHERDFLANWPPGSAAHASYGQRITEGTPLLPAQAVRGEGVALAPAAAGRSPEWALHVVSPARPTPEV